jgi:hypothetical protein
MQIEQPGRAVWELDDWVEAVEAVKAVRHAIVVAPVAPVAPVAQERKTPRPVPVPLDIVSGPNSPAPNAEFSGTFISEIQNPAKPGQ